MHQLRKEALRSRRRACPIYAAILVIYLFYNELTLYNQLEYQEPWGINKVGTKPRHFRGMQYHVRIYFVHGNINSECILSPPLQ